MADNNNTTNTTDNSALYLIVGGLLVAVAAIFFLFFNGKNGTVATDTSSVTEKVSTDVDTPDVKVDIKKD